MSPRPFMLMPTSSTTRFLPRLARLTVTALVIAAAPMPVSTEERVDGDAIWKIRREATERSGIMDTLHVLTDVYGPRLTGSPNLKAAGEWAAARLTGWGLKDARLEPWDFGRPGWVNERFAGFIVSPVKDSLVGEVVAWTPGTDGTVTAQAVLIEPPARPTEAELTAWLETVKGRVPGRVVLVGKPAEVPVSFNGAAKRREESDLRAMYDPEDPRPPQYPRAAARHDDPKDGPRRLTPNQVTRRIDAFLVASGARLRVNDAGREHGQVRAFANRTYDVTKAVPTVVLRNEDYGRIARLIAGGRAVELEFTIVNRTFPEGRTQYNVIADIPGADRADEIVMIGGHLDSWHAATGATDNAAGSAVAMEAVRILQALQLKPRRTIRIALWGGEEQGLLGSQAYVKQHLGTFESPAPGFAKHVAYFNVDSGTGRARGLSVFGPPEAAAVMRDLVAPFRDLGVVGTLPSKSRRLGGSDHTSFNQSGLTGIGVGQDPIEYFSHTWHTNLDTYERIVPEDVRNAAIVVAAAAYHVAMRDEPLPRFTSAQMPPAPPEEDEDDEAQPAAPAKPTPTVTAAPAPAPAASGRQ